MTGSYYLQVTLALSQTISGCLFEQIERVGKMHNCQQILHKCGTHAQFIQNKFDLVNMVRK